MNSRRLLLPLCLLCGGALAGRFIGPPPDTRPASSGHPAGSVPAATTPEPSPPAVLTKRPFSPAHAKAWDFLQKLEHTPAVDFPALWAELEAAGKEDQVASQKVSWEERLFAERWAELDPAAASQFFLAKPDLKELVRAVFGTWSRVDEGAALAAVTALKKSAQWEAMAGILSAAAKDPAALLSWGRKLLAVNTEALDMEKFVNVVSIEDLRRAWAHDPAACQELAAAMPDWFRQQLESIAVADEAAKNLPAALARMDAAGLTKDDAAAFVLNMMPLADSHPQRLVAIVEHLTKTLGPGWLRLRNEGDYLLLALAKAEPERVHSILAQAASEQNGTAIFQANAAASLLSTNPRLALQLAPSSSGAWLNEFAEGRSAQVSAIGTPQQVLDLMSGAPPSYIRDSLLAGALGQLSPEAAAAWIDTLPPGELQAVARATVESATLTPQLAELHRAAAGAAAESSPAALDMVKRLAGIAAQSDPASAAAHIATLPEGPARDTALVTTGKAWAQVSAPEALAWAESLPPQAQSEALSGILEMWTGYEPGTAANYIAALPRDASRDAPIAGFARGLQRLDPEASLLWAAQVQDAGRRRAVLDEVAAGWMQRDAGAARASISEIPGLTEDERQRLTKPAAP